MNDAMNVDERIITEGLRTLEDHGAARGAPVADLVRRGRAARVRRTAKLGTAGLGLVGAVALFVATTGSSTPPGTAVQNVSLAMAAHETAEASFHVTITTHLQGMPSSSDQVIAGAYDPAHQNAYLDQVSKDSWAAFGGTRMVAGVCYMRLPMPMLAGGGPWMKTPDCLSNGGDLGTTAGVETDPDALLQQLAADGAAKLVSRTGSGAHEVDTWRYSYTGPDKGSAPGAPPRISTTTGTATVDAATHHVTSLTIAESHLVEGAFSKDAVSATYRFFDFGAPVSVTAPPVVVTPSPVSTAATPGR